MFLNKKNPAAQIPAAWGRRDACPDRYAVVILFKAEYYMDVDYDSSSHDIEPPLTRTYVLCEFKVPSGLRPILHLFLFLGTG